MWVGLALVFIIGGALDVARTMLEPPPWWDPTLEWEAQARARRIADTAWLAEVAHESE